MDIGVKIAKAIYEGAGGDPKQEFTSEEEIYNEVDKLFGGTCGRVKTEMLDVNITSNGSYTFSDPNITGYKPVNIDVNVDVGTAYDDGYKAGYTTGYTDGETEGYSDGYAEGLDDGFEDGVIDQKEKLETIEITSNGTYTKEDGYNEVKVDVHAEVDFSVLGYDKELCNALNTDIQSDIDYSVSVKDKLGNSTSAGSLYYFDYKLVYAPYFDTSKVNNMSLMFNNCYSLSTVPQFDTSQVNNMYYMFNGCSSLTAVPQFDTSKVINMNSMFYGCTLLTSVPQFDTSKVTTMSGMFGNCRLLTSVPQFDTSQVNNMSSMFYNSTMLTSVPQFDTSKVTTMSSMFGGCTSLNDVGGFKNLGMQPNLTTSSAFSGTNNLTHDSIMNIINNLYDRKSAGYSVVTLPLGSTNLARISDEEKAIATNKGWTLS